MPRPAACLFPGRWLSLEQAPVLRPLRAPTPNRLVCTGRNIWPFNGELLCLPFARRVRRAAVAVAVGTEMLTASLSSSTLRRSRPRRRYTPCVQFARNKPAYIGNFGSWAKARLAKSVWQRAWSKYPNLPNLQIQTSLSIPCHPRIPKNWWL